MESALLLASVYLLAAVVIVPLAARTGLGSVLGYLAAGLLIGPALGLVGTETRDLQHVAEFGVVMMLFLIGLELDPRTLWDMRVKLIGLGGLQVAGTTLAILLALMAMGQGWQAGLAVGMILSLSSTAIVLQTLSEKNLMRSQGGRSAFAVLLTQDIAVVPMLAIIPLLAGAGAAPAPVPDAHGAEGTAEVLMTLVERLPGWAAALLTLGIVAGIIAAGHFLTRPVFRYIHAARLAEMSTAVSLLMVAGIAFLMTLVGLSPALGTFLAGVVLANSEFRHQIEADIRPFKGILMGLFFMTVGAGIDLSVLAGAPGMILGLTLGLIALKAAVLLALAVGFGVAGRDRWLFALSLAQGGEFGFLLLSFAVTEAVLPQPVAQVALLVISLSMLATPALFLAAERLGKRLAVREDAPEPDRIEDRGRVIIAGIGRFGQVVNRLVRYAGAETVVLDADMAAIETVRKFGVKTYYGDPTRPEMLAAAGLEEADVLVIAIDDPARATQIARYARQQRPDLHIVARARDRVHVYELYQAGADDIVRETFDSSVRAGRYVLENIGFTDYEANRLSQTFVRLDRAAVRDLAEVWVPGLPVDQNPAYVERAKALNRDIETALIAELDDARRKPDAAE
jgi:CPA2 family monovalent cation:H+ antiporter-2